MTFDAIFVPAELRESVSDRAWLAALLEAEGALARAGARAGVIPEAAAAEIAAACRAELYDVEALADQGRAVGNPAEPLVRALREAVGGDAAGFVHRGATSQDVVDTAAMLVSRRALDLVLAELDGAAAACARLAGSHRETPMAARTLLQQAVPTTFGLKAAGWLVGLLDARRRLAVLRDESLAAQLGGAAGTLAALGGSGVEVLELYAGELGLHAPVAPWHTNRVRIAELGAALAIAAGAAAKVGLDIALLAQTEVGEVAEGGGRGGSSTMPQKRNPVGSAIAGACARHARACSGVLAESLVQEHERAAGAWQAEWTALSGALAYAGGAAAALREALDGLEVDPGRMRANIGEAALAERIALALAGRVGRARAHELVAAAARRAAGAGRSLRDELAEDPEVALDGAEVDRLLDPAGYLGSAPQLVDRALELYRGESGGA